MTDIKELKDEELEKVAGGDIGDTAPKYSCRAEDSGSDVTVMDHIRRKSDNVMFECDGYANGSNQTIWTFYNLDKPNEKLLFTADSVNKIIYGFKR